MKNIVALSLILLLQCPLSSPAAVTVTIHNKIKQTITVSESNKAKKCNIIQDILNKKALKPKDQLQEQLQTITSPLQYLEDSKTVFTTLSAIAISAIIVYTYIRYSKHVTPLKGESSWLTKIASFI